MVHQVATFAEFKEKIATPGKVVFVDFFADWCGPCKQIAPEFEKLSQEYPNCVFIKVNIDDVDKAADEFSIQSLPTFMAFKDGQKVDAVIGANPEALQRLVKDNAA